MTIKRDGIGAALSELTRAEVENQSDFLASERCRCHSSLADRSVCTALSAAVSTPRPVSSTSARV